MPGWQTFAELNESDDFVFIAVAMDVGGVKDVKHLYEGAGAKYVTLVDPQNAMGEAWGFKVVPNGWLIDESGKVVFKQLGGFEVRSPKTIETVEAFLQKPPVAKGQIKAAKSDTVRKAELKAAISEDRDDGPANLELGTDSATTRQSGSGAGVLGSCNQDHAKKCTGYVCAGVFDRRPRRQKNRPHRAQERAQARSRQLLDPQADLAP